MFSICRITITPSFRIIPPRYSVCIGDQILCFQAHPEFVHTYSRALLELRHEQLREPVYTSALGSMQVAQQGRTVAEWMMRFISYREMTSAA